jgi:hypothetical protein
MRNIVLPLVILVGCVSGYDPFYSVDPNFDSSLSCYNCIQNDYLYCR